MSDKVEGTLTLDGLVEGRSADLAEVEPKLREWRAFVEKAGLRFSLETEGNSFSLLAENKPVEVRKLGGNPAEVISEALNQLLGIFPAEERRGIFSTVRSLEYRKDVEVQTVYGIGPDGAIKARERTVEAKTVAPEAPPTLREKILLAVVGVSVAAAVLALSTLFIDWRGFWNRNVLGNLPADVKAIEVDLGRFAPYVAVAARKAAGRNVVLSLKRTDAFPRTDADAEKLIQSAASLSDRLAVEALVRGRLWVEYYDRDKKLITFGFVVIRPLRDKDVLELELPVPSDRPTARIAFCD